MTLRSEDATAVLEVGRVMVFLGEAFVVTVRQEGGDTLERARRRLQLVSAKQPGALEVLHAVVATVVDDLSATSSQVEASLLASAGRLFGDEPSDEAHDLYRITRQLLALAHAVQPLIEPLRHLSTGAADGVDGEVARRFQDVLDHVLVVDREVNAHSELLEHLRGSNDSRIGLQQNTDMRKIATWAAVIAVPTAITGFYGMNVPYPGFGATRGFVVAVVLQTSLALTLFVMFRRSRLALTAGSQRREQPLGRRVEAPAPSIRAAAARSCGVGVGRRGERGTNGRASVAGQTDASGSARRHRLSPSAPYRT